MQVCKRYVYLPLDITGMQVFSRISFHLLCTPRNPLVANYDGCG